MQEFERLVGGEFYFPQGFLSRLRVRTSYMKDSKSNTITRIITVARVSSEDAKRTSFKLTGQPSDDTTSVAEYFSTSTFAAAECYS